MAEVIVGEFRPERIILFGSHASGRAGEESDVDLLVVLPVTGPRYRLAARIRAALPAGVPIDVVVRSPEDAAKAASNGGDPVVAEAMRRGVVLYPAAA